MFVACSALCFGRQTLDEALRTISELQFNKFDIDIHETGNHLKPSEVVADVNAAAARLRYGPGLAPCAFSVQIDAPDAAEYQKQFQAICHLARISAVPLVSIPAASVGSPLESETARLKKLSTIAQAEGVVLTVPTVTGTLTETPDHAVELCELVPGLGLTLDPSHYITGPHQGQSYDQVFPYVRHVQLRDTGRKPDQFQVRVGQGEIEYGRIITQLARHRYNRILSVDIRDIPDPPFPLIPEVRKLKYLLESLV